MQAAYHATYGPADVLTLRDIPQPRIGATDVLVQVHASAVTTADWRLRASAFPGYAWLIGRLMFGLFAPRNNVLGSDFSGQVVAVGPDVRRFALGDPVFGFAGKGAHAEYLAVSQDAAIALKPKNLGHAQAAAVPFGALSALVFLRDFAKIRRDDRVLILGATGGVGVFAVQLAKHFGAHVTGVSSGANAELLRTLGADRVIDHEQQDFTEGRAVYDVVLDTAGITRFSRIRRALRVGGRFVPLEFGLREIGQSLLNRLRGKRVVIGVSGDTQQDLLMLADLLTSGALVPVIDGSYPLAQIAEAHRRVETRHKRGSVVVTVHAQGQNQLAAE